MIKIIHGYVFVYGFKIIERECCLKHENYYCLFKETRCYLHGHEKYVCMKIGSMHVCVLFVVLE